jgi:GNAT superfamily N-acetyltransferase
MTEITVRVLEESEWSVYRDVRLRALAESPGSFTATLAEEADRDERFWRDRMTRSHRLVAERGPLPQGIVSVGAYEQEPSAAEVFGLYVVPEAPGTGVSWRLVEAAAALATQQAYLQLYTGWGPTTGERSASLRTSGSAPPTTAAQHAPPTSNRVRRLPWCCRWSPTPPWRRIRPAGSQPPAKAPSAETPPNNSSPGPKKCGAAAHARTATRCSSRCLRFALAPDLPIGKEQRPCKHPQPSIASI